MLWPSHGVCEGQGCIDAVWPAPRMAAPDTGRSLAFWARGYCERGVGLNEEVIKKYIRNQEDCDKLGADNGRSPLMGRRQRYRSATSVAAGTTTLIGPIDTTGHAGGLNSLLYT